MTNGKYDTDDIQTAVSYYSKNIVKMAGLLDSVNCRFLCVISPYDENKGYKKAKIYGEKYSLFPKEVKKRFNENKIQHIDLNDYKAEITSDKFLDNMHLNASGNLTVAKIVSNVVRKTSFERISDRYASITIKDYQND